MVPPIPTVHREQILQLRNAGHSFRDIREILIREHDVTYSVIGIGNCFQKMMRNGGQLESQPKQKYSKDVLERIKGELQSILESNSFLTGQQQIEQIKQRLGITISMDAVGRYRRLLGWRVLPTDDGFGQSSSSSKKKPVRVSDGETSLAGSSGGSCNSSITSYTDDTSSLLTGHAKDSGSALQISNNLQPMMIEPSAPLMPTSQVIKREEFLIHPYADIRGVQGADTPTYPDNINFSLSSCDLLQTMAYRAPLVDSLVDKESLNRAAGDLLAGAIDQPKSSNGSQQQISVDSPSALPTFSSPEQSAQVRFGPQHIFTSKSFIKSGQASNFKYQVWAGISHMGATSICIWDAECRVKSSFYCDTILSKFFLPFRSERYSGRPCVLVQNNDTIYRSNETRQFMIENEIEYETWTHTKYGGVSNPIELVWDDINDYVKNEVKPMTLDALRESICIFWATKMTDSRCRSYLKRCAIYSD